MNSFTTVIYTFKVSKHNNWTVHEYKCLFLTSVFLQIERESGIQNLGIKEKCPQSYLSYFTKVFHWRIFLLSRATRLCSVFNTGLKNSGPSCLSILLSSTRSKMAMVRLPATDPAQKLTFLLSISADGGGSPTSVLGSQPIIWLLSPSPFGVWRPEVTKYQHLLIPLCDLHSSLTARYC